MKSTRIGAMLAAGLALAAAGMVHAAVGTLSFSSDVPADWGDGIADDGQGGSTALAGITIQVLNISDTAGTNLDTPGDDAPIEWRNAADLSNTQGFTGLTTFAFGDGVTAWKGMAVRSADGSEFQINQFRWYDWGYTGGTVLVTGFRDAASVASTSFVANDGDAIITVVLDPTFDAVDEVRITYQVGLGYPTINDIAIGDMVLPNNPPTVANPIPNQNATEDAAFNFTFAANTFNDLDVGNTLSYSAQLAGGGALPAWLSFNPATRTFSGTPLNAHVGSVSIDVTASDGNGGSVVDTFSIVVANTNDAPTVANPIPNQIATEDAAFIFTFAANTFNDVDVGNTLGYSAQLAGGGALPAWLAFNSATRTFSGTPLNAHVGSVSIDVIASDGNGGSVVDTFDIVVANTNDAPTVANPIPNQNATEDAAFNFTFAANTFADVDGGDTLSYSAQLAGGGALPAWLSFNAATRSFSGTPLNAHVGGVSIDVIAADGNGGSVTDTFDIVVANANDAPTVANPIPNQNATEDAAFNFSFAANAFNDVDGGDTLTYAAQLAGGGALPGWLTFNPAARNFSGTPLDADVGTTSIDVSASDGNGGSAVDTFDIVVADVNEFPVAIDDSGTVARGATVTVLDGGATSILANDTDAEDDPLTAILITGPANGMLTLNPNGTFSYTHNNSVTSSDSFTYRANDGTDSSSVATVNFSITFVNIAPVAVDDAYSVNEDTTLTVSAANRVTLNDTDANGDPLTVQLVANVAQGSLSLNADGTFTYAPAANYNGPDSFTYRANDGSLDSNVATVTLTVNPVGDAPTGGADSDSVLRGGTRNVAAPGLLANDSDVDGDALTVVSIFQLPAHGTLSFGADGSFSYAHNGSAPASDSFVYVLADTDPATPNVNVSVTLSILDNPPVAVDDAISIAEGGSASTLVGGASSVLANDSDSEGDALTAVLVGGPTNGALTLNPDGSFLYAHDGSETSSDSFTYRADDVDGSSNIATVTISISAVNDAPLAIVDAISVAEGGTATTLVGGATSVLANDSDAESDPLTAVVVTAPSNGALTLNADGTFSYVHDGSETASDGFSYQASDGTALSNIVTVTITISAVNAAPMAVADAISVAEGGTATTLAGGATSVLANDTDPESDPLTAILLTAPTNGTLSLNADGTFSYVHDGGESVVDGFSYRSSDGTLLSGPVDVAITVAGVNDAPLNQTPAAQSVAVDTDLRFGMIDGNAIVVTDVDAGAGSLRITLVATQGVLSLGAVGGLTFEQGDGVDDATVAFTADLVAANAALDGLVFAPTSGYTGAATIEVRSDDQGNTGGGGAGVDIDSVAITVTAGAPRVVAVGSTSADDIYGIGEAVSVRVRFDQAVIVDTAGGLPTLRLETGATDRDAVFVAGSGAELTFSYVVQSGDSSPDLDIASTAALLPNAATLRNAGGVDALLALPTPGGPSSIAGQHALLIDGVAPMVSSVAVPPAGSYSAGQALDFVVGFDQTVLVAGGVPRIVITLDEGGSAEATYLSGSGSSALTFRYVVAGAHRDPTGIVLAASIDANGATLRDAAGNDAALALAALPSTAGIVIGQGAPGFVAPITVPATSLWALLVLALAIGVLATRSSPRRD